MGDKSPLVDYVLYHSMIGSALFATKTTASPRTVDLKLADFVRYCMMISTVSFLAMIQ